MRRRRSVSNWATRHIERFGIDTRRPHISQYAYRASSPDGGVERAPNIHKRPFNPQTLPAPGSGSKPEPTRRVQAPGEIQRNRPKHDTRDGEILKALH